MLTATPVNNRLADLCNQIAFATEGDDTALAISIADWHDALLPAVESTVVFLDSAFADDVAKTNLAETLKQRGLGNVRSL